MEKLTHRKILYINTVQSALVGNGVERSRKVGRDQRMRVEFAPSF